MSISGRARPPAIPRNLAASRRVLFHPSATAEGALAHSAPCPPGHTRMSGALHKQATHRRWCRKREVFLQGGRRGRLRQQHINDRQTTRFEEHLSLQPCRGEPSTNKLDGHPRTLCQWRLAPSLAAAPERLRPNMLRTQMTSKAVTCTIVRNVFASDDTNRQADNIQEAKHDPTDRRGRAVSRHHETGGAILPSAGQGPRRSLRKTTPQARGRGTTSHKPGTEATFEPKDECNVKLLASGPQPVETSRLRTSEQPRLLQVFG